ncbi:hypothetical protein ECDEC9D_0816 [Escherichia coli DEC9D]|nr:hypothetical protein ECDEC9D_0816 [Escherichia coli DEC9D]
MWITIAPFVTLPAWSYATTVNSYAYYFNCLDNNHPSIN